MCVRVTTALIAAIVCLAAPPAHAQQGIPALKIAEALRAGRCSVPVELSAASKDATARIEVAVNRQPAGRQEVGGRRNVVVSLRAPLQAADAVSARLITVDDVDPPWSDPVTVGPGTGKHECPDPSRAAGGDDERSPFSASIYLGGAVDNFAPAEVGGYTDTQSPDGGYLNPAAGGSSHVRAVGGVDFEFRAVGGPTSGVQLWITGETLHGVRSGDVDCRDAATRPPICDTLQHNFGVSPGAPFLYALEHASSLEAYVAPRLELATVQKGSIAPARFYVTGRFGINMLANDVHEAFDAFHIGAGLLNIKGGFEGSFLEVGWGKSDMFAVEPGRGKWHRLKIDGMLVFPLLQAFTDKAEFWKKAPRAFIQMYADFDPTGRSADSVQTFFGVDFDLNGFVKW